MVSYHVWKIPKIQVNFRFKGISEVLIILFYDFLKFLHNSCFWEQRIHCWYSYQAILFRWPWKARSTSGSRDSQRYWWLCLMEFRNIFNRYVFKVRESFADISTVLLCLGTSKIQNNFGFWRFLRSPIGSSSCTEGCPGYSKSLKHGILVGMPAINSLTSTT